MTDPRILYTAATGERQYLTRQEAYDREMDEMNFREKGIEKIEDKIRKEIEEWGYLADYPELAPFDPNETATYNGWFNRYEYHLHELAARIYDTRQ